MIDCQKQFKIERRLFEWFQENLNGDKNLSAVFAVDIYEEFRDYISNNYISKESAKQETNRWLGFYRDDILNCFIPKCSRCNKVATVQTTKGEHAQKNLSRPVNWGYYCKKCAAEGLEIEREAMYGN